MIPGRGEATEMIAGDWWILMNNLDKIPKASEQLTLARVHLLVLRALPTEKGVGASSRWTQIYLGKQRKSSIYWYRCLINAGSLLETFFKSAMVRIFRGRFWRAITIFQRSAWEESMVWSLKPHKQKPCHTLVWAVLVVNVVRKMARPIVDSEHLDGSKSTFLTGKYLQSNGNFRVTGWHFTASVIKKKIRWFLLFGNWWFGGNGKMQVQQRRTAAIAIYLNVYTSFPKLVFFKYPTSNIFHYRGAL